jgi:23S rRNA pseudouridine2604 synthase
MQPKHKKPQEERLSKIMSQRGICSRREADRYIEAGWVLVNGEVVSELGSKVSSNAQIELKSEGKRKQSHKVTILLNKPIGYVSGQPEKGYPAAIELITAQNQYRRGSGPLFHPGHRSKLAAAGRLDIDSRGLLVFTQDGALVKKLIGEDTQVEKEYLVRVEGEVKESMLQRLTHGLVLDKKKLKPVKVEEIESGLLRFILTEGRKRQIRRMCDQVRLKVISLKRVRVGEMVLGDLPEGKWKFFTQH